ncbi:hypothetical protein BaRGS_00035315 [Batillaria attramentaria]|uniref:Uncharacterized protein n=1 Tax=Batillaria attramentaria TaxID=370345 RepID=A0ABD0JEG6_9CAEN
MLGASRTCLEVIVRAPRGALSMETCETSIYRQTKQFPMCKHNRYKLAFQTGARVRTGDLAVLALTALMRADNSSLIP